MALNDLEAFDDSGQSKVEELRDEVELLKRTNQNLIAS